MKSLLIRAITFLAGLYFIVEFLLPAHIGDMLGFGASHSAISYGIICVGVPAVGLGLLNLLSIHGGRIKAACHGASKEQFFYSTALLLGLFLSSGATVLDWRASLAREDLAKPYLAASLLAEKLVKTPDTHSYQALAATINDLTVSCGSLQSWDKDATTLPSLLRVCVDETQQKFDTEYQGSFSRGVYRVITEGLFTPLGAAIFSLLAFYIAVAAFRAFRIRTREGALMMISAVIVILGQTSFGLSLWEGFPALRLWLLEVPNSAAFRAIKIGASVAGLVLAIRMWLSLDKEAT